jgi:hypothetical protein
VGRTIAVHSVPAVVLAACWVRLESPRSGGDAVMLLLLALAPALLPTTRLRLAGAIVAALAAGGIALDVSPFDEGALRSGLSDGTLEFYDVAVPFDPHQHPEMHGALLLALFAGALAVALCIAARKPFPAVLALVAGAGWPATLLADGGELVFGTAILAGALWVLAGLRVRAPRAALPAVVVGAAVVAVAGIATTSDAVAKGALLDWERWDLYDAPARPVGVDYVWDASYEGIDFPDKRTVVLRITAPRRSLYWRATTLDGFDGGRWYENLYPVTTRPVDGPLPADPLVIAQPRQRWIRQEVEVVALRDDHLVAAGAPVQLRTNGIGPLFLLSGGVARLSDGTLRQGQRYIVWSAVPSPTARGLAGLRANYPAAVVSDLDVDTRVRMLPFGDSGRAEQLRRIFTDDRTQNLWAYRPFVEAAQRVTRGAKRPYEAVVALESWFRTTGGFRYEEQPPQPDGLPPLVDFVTRTKAGYCQHFAGAMALMLRYLGIPARVAVGFTSGKYQRGRWSITDHDAHAWVEVWFPGEGWVSFDPTPGRGTLAADYTFASDSASTAREAIGEAIQGVGGGLDPTAGGPEFGTGTGGFEEDGGRIGIVRIALLVLAVGVLGIGLVKVVRRRVRYATRDPRRRAAAARSELADFLRDQGYDVPPSATLEDLRHLLAAELGVNGGPFTSAAGAASYGPPDGSALAAQRAREELRSLLRAVRSRLSTADRARGWLATRSLRA